MGKPVKIVVAAKRMISLSGRTDVKIEFTEDSPSWREALRGTLECEGLQNPPTMRDYDCHGA